MNRITLNCRCGAVCGVAESITPENGNRVVCCCADCQAFAQQLGRGEDTLDQFGGTEIFQLSQSQVKITKGHDKLQCMRLSKKGLLRWYTTCCNTPVGNSMSAGMPFFGIIHTFISEVDRGKKIGPVRAYVQTQHAIGEPDYPKHSAKFPLGLTLRIMRMMLMWRLQGKHKPSEFFTPEGRPRVKPKVS